MSDQLENERGGDKPALRALAVHYANAVDEGDSRKFISAFLPDAKLVVRNGDATLSERQGHAQLEGIPARAQTRFDCTMHFLGQSLYDIGPDGASGVVYCIAHHLKRTEHGGTNHVMYIRYRDTYRRDAAGDWKIASRVVGIDWTETRAANPAGT